ncbi:MAG: glycosyltransferase, partial [Gallionella sp.]
GHIEKFVAQNALDEQVRFLGFVPAEDMRGLYEGSLAVVMPTYFGPTNLPPLEAWSVGKPLIYSSHLQEHSGNAAISVDPDNAGELAVAMKKCAQNGEAIATLVEHGTSRLRHFEQMRDSAEKELTNRLLQFEVRLSSWK